MTTHKDGHEPIPVENGERKIITMPFSCFSRCVFAVIKYLNISNYPTILTQLNRWTFYIGFDLNFQTFIYIYIYYQFYYMYLPYRDCKLVVGTQSEINS